MTTNALLESIALRHLAGDHLCDRLNFEQSRSQREAIGHLPLLLGVYRCWLRKMNQINRCITKGSTGKRSVHAQQDG